MGANGAQEAVDEHWPWILSPMIFKILYISKIFKNGFKLRKFFMFANKLFFALVASNFLTTNKCSITKWNWPIFLMIVLYGEILLVRLPAIIKLQGVDY